MDDFLVQLSRTMSHALRHEPDLYGITLDKEGWVSTQDLLNALRRHRSAWSNLSEDDLRDLNEQSEKSRFEIKDGKIRAFYGHSIAEKMEKEQATPPPILYHGTTPQAAESIRAEGLKPMNRQYIHLSADQETALQVARRRTKRPVILKILAEKAHQQGIIFYLGNDKVWLADHIPSEYIFI